MNSINSLLKVFQSRKMMALLLLGFSSGLPLHLTGLTLQTWMTKEGVNLTAIGLFSLVGLPYAIKFLWSPLVDKYRLPFLGRRRGWLIVTQVGLLIAIATMAIQQPKQALQLLAINALVIAAFSATQDIAADAYRTDILHPLEMGAGAAVFVTGYRVAMLFTGSLALILADKIPKIYPNLPPWPTVYLVMASAIVIGIIGTLLAPEPEEVSPPASLSDAVILSFGDFFERKGLLLTVVSLAFIVLYPLGDALLGNMSRPFLLDKGLGFTQTEVGVIQGGLGLFASIIGTLVGGSILSKIGINRSLWVFGLLQAVSNLAYFLLATVGKNQQVLALTINIENFCGGLATAGFVAFLMSLCNKRFSATQYALLSSFMSFARVFLVAPAGKIAESTGWQLFFLLTIVAAIPGLLLLPIVAPWNAQPVTLPRPGLEEEEV